MPPLYGQKRTRKYTNDALLSSQSSLGSTDTVENSGDIPQNPIPKLLIPPSEHILDSFGGEFFKALQESDENTYKCVGKMLDFQSKEFLRPVS